MSLYGANSADAPPLSPHFRPFGPRSGGGKISARAAKRLDAVSPGMVC